MFTVELVKVVITKVQLMIEVKQSIQLIFLILPKLELFNGEEQEVLLLIIGVVILYGI